MNALLPCLAARVALLTLLGGAVARLLWCDAQSEKAERLYACRKR